MASSLLLLTMSLLLTGPVRPSGDIAALLEFKKGVKSDPTGYLTDSWTDESIDFDGCPSSWNGVICNGGKVAAVILDNLAISADVDIGVFANLTKLVKLSLANNSITGRLPYTISAFKTLEFLDVSNNLFASPLPTELGNVKTLRNLSLAGNAFSGAVPESLSGLTSLEFADLSRNTFTGWLPSAFAKLPRLTHLNCSFNSFSNWLPKGLERVGLLKTLDLRGNLVEGSVAEFLMETNASYVDLSGNRVSGKMAGVSESVKYLNLSGNRVSGGLIGRGELGMFSGIRVLDLSGNEMTGTLPGFDFAYEMEVLRLGGNMFSGVLPNDLLKGDSSVLVELDLSGNNLTGGISSILSSSLTILKLSSNHLTGELPLLIGSCTHIDFSNNKLSGDLKRISKWDQLQHLDLSSNHITGELPKLPSFPRLNHLNLSSNSLSKSIPNLSPLFPKLTALDLSYNSLSGPLPKSLISSILQTLILRNNSLTGPIQLNNPLTKSSLIVLDLSHNQIRGYFPNGFASMTELEVLNLAGNFFNGSLPVSMEEMTSLVALDLSQNLFSGGLPGNLTGALKSFNVSYNDLSGDVPENLRRFPRSSFSPGNDGLNVGGKKGERGHKKRMNVMIVVLVAVSCFIALILLVLLAIFVHYVRISRGGGEKSGRKEGNRRGEENTTIVVSAEELVATRKEYSPTKQTEVSWSPASGDSLPRLDVRSPDKLVGELHFLDEALTISPEELSRAPAEVLGRSSHGTSYRASLENGVLLTVKWLKEGVAKQRKEFAKEAKKFATIRHPNVVALRGYYWGPTQHEQLILSEFISPGGLASFLYDQPGRKNPPLNWDQRLKIIVDIARGLNYLHLDRAIPHGNMKATNVLLEGSDLNARVSDYCLHKLMTNEGIAEQISDADILGYCAPELAASKKPLPSFKSDVYAFGVIILEILTGRRASDSIPGGEGALGLTEMVRLRVAEGRGAEWFDPLLVPEMGDLTVEKAMKEVLEIALRCVRSDRPGIKSLYEDLSSI